MGKETYNSMPNSSLTFTYFQFLFKLWNYLDTKYSLRKINSRASLKLC